MRYTKEHEWARNEGGETVCGISDYAQKALGDIVYVELPAVGKTVKAGDQIAVVESAKAASEIYAPVSGTVLAVNEALSGSPETVNQSPEKEGWIFKLKATDEGADLLDPAGYQAYVKGLLG